MQILQNVNIDWIGKKKLYLILSLTMLGISLFSLLFIERGGPRMMRGLPLGVDFRGGTLVYVKFAQAPNEEQIRSAVQAAGINDARIQRYGDPDDNQVIIAIDQKEKGEEALSHGRDQIVNALMTRENAPRDQRDFNSLGASTLQQHLLEKDPLRAGSDSSQRYLELSRAILGFRDADRGGLLANFDDLRGVADPAVIATLKQDFYLGTFSVRNVEVVGPQVGAQLQKQALLATLYSSVGMLVYLWFRFELIYGAAAVLAVVHDTIITLGVFSLLGKEISLTVLAAILTLIGYSMNDTIVIFDRVRENLKLLRRERLPQLVNISVNQTLSRTALTSGLTFLTVLSLLLFGGEVLHGFSLALVVGILLGTYSTLAVAAPLLVVYQEWRAGRSGGASPALVSSGKRDKVRA